MGQRIIKTVWTVMQLHHSLWQMCLIPKFMSQPKTAIFQLKGKISWTTSTIHRRAWLILICWIINTQVRDKKNHQQGSRCIVAVKEYTYWHCPIGQHSAKISNLHPLSAQRHNFLSDAVKSNDAGLYKRSLHLPPAFPSGPAPTCFSLLPLAFVLLTLGVHNKPSQSRMTSNLKLHFQITDAWEFSSLLLIIIQM